MLHRLCFYTAFSDALSKISQAWQLLSTLRLLYSEASERGTLTVDAAGYPTSESLLVPGSVLSLGTSAGDSTMPITIAPRFAECLLLEQVGHDYVN